MSVEPTPLDGLRRILDEVPPTDARVKVVLLSTGSFNPVHRQHVDLFSIAARCLEYHHPELHVLMGFMSPSVDWHVVHKLGRSEAIPFHHRVAMCRLAISESRQQEFHVEVDTWEGRQPEFVDFPGVKRRLQGRLDEEFPGSGIVVLYLSGMDLFLKCHLANKPRNVGVLRPPFSRSSLPVECPEKHIYLLDTGGAGTPEASSTKVRELRDARKPLGNLVGDSVAEYLYDVLSWPRP